MIPTISRRGFLRGAAAVAALGQHPPVLAEGGQAPPSPYTLHFAQPASKWPDALPVGNGRLGAMVFGMPGMERIQLNEESIWDGEPGRDRTNPHAAGAITQMRKLLFEGKISEAESMGVSDVLSVPRRMPCYQTLGDLHLDFSEMGLGPEANVDAYRLQLDLDQAIVTTTFTHGGAEFRREIFSSAPDQVIVIRLTASKPGSLSLAAQLDRPQDYQVTREAGDRLVLTGQALPVNDNPGLPVKEHHTGVRFYAEVQILHEGGSLQDASDAKALIASKCNSITLLLDCATSYRYPERNGEATGENAADLVGDPEAMRAAVRRNLSAAARRPYAELKARHLADYRRFFRRVDLLLGSDAKSQEPTDARIKQVKAGGEDVSLLPIYFQYGRYLLISSSRPGTLAANLQGIWNESVDPPWGSKYTVNINAEMNYWFAESANLSELHLPLFDLLQSTVKSGQLTAHKLYGASGSVVHHNTDIWGDSGPIDGLGGGIWPMGACWLSLHLWTHYAFTGDRVFLERHAYPALRENVQFLLDYLVQDPKTGRLVTGPSCSPENSYIGPDGKSHNLCMGPTMDISIVRAVFSRFLEATNAMGSNGSAATDVSLVNRVKAAEPRLLPFQIGHDGRLQEWSEDYRDHEPGHRHISHLFGLFPEDQITVDGTPELARAARLVLDKRLSAGGGSTGWSRSWIVNCMARLRDGEACHANLLELLRQSTRPNLFDVCGLKENSPFQIDGNLGGPNGIIEMLLQSHGQTPLSGARKAGSSAEQEIPVRFLPALPKAWTEGQFRGLRTRGGLEVECVWSQGRATKGTVQASRAGRFRVIAPAGQRVSVQRGNGGSPAEAQPELVLRTQAGRRYELIFS